MEDPDSFVKLLEELTSEHGVEAWGVSSGYGVAPLKLAWDATVAEILEATYTHPIDDSRGHRIHALRAVLLKLREGRLRAWLVPGAAQLPTLPKWLRVNKIDLGTSDKVLATAAALAWEVEEYHTPLTEVSLVAVEVGYAYTAALAVKGGVVVAGVGGTTAPGGYLGMGAWDAEVAYLASWLEPSMPKEALFAGGCASLLGRAAAPEEVEEAARRGDEGAVECIECLAATTVATVAEAAALAGSWPRRVYLLARWPRSSPTLVHKITSKLRSLNYTGGVVSTLPVPVKEAALGGCLVASGAEGGRYEWLVKAMKLREAEPRHLHRIAIRGWGERAAREVEERAARIGAR